MGVLMCMFLKYLARNFCIHRRIVRRSNRQSRNLMHRFCVQSASAVNPQKNVHSNQIALFQQFKLTSGIINSDIKSEENYTKSTSAIVFIISTFLQRAFVTIPA